MKVVQSEEDNIDAETVDEIVADMILQSLLHF
jgi:hypothetical protein